MEASTNNLAGHRAKYELLKASLPKEEVGSVFVGGGDAVLTGYNELELIRKFKSLHGASVIDIGCGIGRLTRYLIEENLAEYLGLDIVPEILREAEKLTSGQPLFKFGIVENCKLPSADASADVVCGFSLITHLLDEEIFEYFLEARRVLRSGGVAVFSFIDFENDTHLSSFVAHARHHRHGHGDLLKYTTKSILQRLARCAGFSSTSFIEEGRAVVGASARGNLIDGRDAPREVVLGQSVCAMFI
jgi:ubiquinone/menaquinone biosynthesis C-methylase UbiE